MVDRSEHIYDVFVSYAHADDGTPLGMKHGWVTAFTDHLNKGPNAYPKKMCTDHKLKPGDEFSEDLLAKVKNSTLLLLVLSNNYIKSEWCGKELDHFVRTHSKDAEKPLGVFVVELWPYSELTGIPPNIDDVCKRLIRARFWYEPTDGSTPGLHGYPLPKPDDVGYWGALLQLRNAIDSRLRSISEGHSFSSVRTVDALSGTSRTGTKPALGTILLADTTEDLVQLRSVVKAALEPEGVVVLPERNYSHLTLEEFQSEFTRDLARCDLFVQMLSTTTGCIGKDFTVPLPQLQFRGAVAAKRPILQWCECLPAPGRITDIEHAKLFKTEYLRATNRSAFEREVLERLRAIKQSTEIESRLTESEPSQVTTKKLLFIDDVAGESDLNQKLRDILKSADCVIRSLPPHADLCKIGKTIVAQVLGPCRAGIVVFADLTQFHTVWYRLVFFVNQIATFDLRVMKWAIYVTPETRKCKFEVGLDDLRMIDEQLVVSFIRELEP